MTGVGKVACSLPAGDTRRALVKLLSPYKQSNRRVSQAQTASKADPKHGCRRSVIRSGEMRSAGLRWVVLVSLAAGCAARLAPHGPPYGADVEARIARVASELGLFDRMKYYRVPAVSIAVIDDDAIAWTRAWGLADAAEGTPAGPETLFQAASISKSVAAVALLRLWEEGRLDLDHEVNRRLRSWQLPPSPLVTSEQVTLRRILTHTAGLSVSGFAGYRMGAPLPTLSQILDGSPPANNRPVRIVVAPGSAWRYSGGGFEVSEQLVSDVTGTPFVRFAAEAVLQPVGMASSTFEQPPPPALAARTASGHNLRGRPLD